MKFTDILEENINEAAKTKFKLKTVLQISKMRFNKRDAIDNIILIGTNQKPNSKLRFLEKSDTLESKDEKEFIEANSDKIKKMYKSPKFLKLVQDSVNEQIRSNDFNYKLPPEVRDWAISLVMKIKDVGTLYKFNGKDMWKSIKITRNPSSKSLDTNVKFKLNGKEEEKEFNLDPSGYWG